MPMRLRGRLVLLVLAVSLSGASFLSAQPAKPMDLAASARVVAEGVGKIGEINSAGTKGPVFVFEEFHTSRVGQLQTAVMLLRLHGQYSLRTLGLEGAIQGPRSLDATWFHTLGGSLGSSARDDIAVRMLAEGEISQAEFMAMVFPDIRVLGMERREE